MLCLVLICATPATGQVADVPDALRSAFDSAYFAWDRGDYPDALERAERILTTPGGEDLLERIALLTGELHPVDELSPEGGRAQWSPDGRFASFETGIGDERQTRIFEVGPDGVRELGDLPGRAATFAPDGRLVAYLHLPESPQLRARWAREREAWLSGDAATLRSVRAELGRLEAAAARVIVRDLESGQESERSAPGLDKWALSFAADGTLVLVASSSGRTDATDLYALPWSSPPTRLTDGPGSKGATLIRAGAERLVFTIGSDRIGILDMRTPETWIVEGRSPAVSADGSTLAFLTTVRQLEPEIRRGAAATGADVRGPGHLTALMVMRLDQSADPVAIKETTLPLASPALSPSGRRIAYAAVIRDDWEIFVIGTDGGGETRVTRDIQNDLFPRFLSESRILAVRGEARHRRAYLHDLDRDHAAEIAAAPIAGSDERSGTRLFHNNTLRTVAPQYEWSPSPDGSRVLVVADRDGDTLSPQRGVHLVDLTRRVTDDELLARVRHNLAAERVLRDHAQRIFEPIEADVRSAVGEVDVARIFDHAHALYQFGSKFMTRPGNRLAIEYLANSLRRMGYVAELQWFEPRPGVRTANVVATLRGTTSPDRITVISSHFDSVEQSPGADDNSSGTTALLEAARVLANRPQPGTIKFAFLTAEEAGLLGALEFVRRARAAGDQVVSVINNDMIGWTRSHRLDNTIRYSNPAIRDIQHAAAIRFTKLITYDARYVRNTDAHVFFDAYGDIIGGIGSYPILGNPHYHQRHDTLESVDHRLVAEVSRATIATAMLLASRGY
jgi:hypothetical protein